MVLQVDGMGWISPGGVMYRAPYGANKGHNVFVFVMVFVFVFCLFLLVGQVMFPHHSDQMSQGSQNFLE